MVDHCICLSCDPSNSDVKRMVGVSVDLPFIDGVLTLTLLVLLLLLLLPASVNLQQNKSIG